MSKSRKTMALTILMLCFAIGHVSSAAVDFDTWLQGALRQNSRGGYSAPPNEYGYKYAEPLGQQARQGRQGYHDYHYSDYDTGKLPNANHFCPYFYFGREVRIF